MVFQRSEQNVPGNNAKLRLLNRTLAFRNSDSMVNHYEYSGESPVPSMANNYLNGKKVGAQSIDFRTISRSDDIFSLSHYGFTEPAVKQLPSLTAGLFSLPVLIVIVGVLVCAIGIALKGRRK